MMNDLRLRTLAFREGLDLIKSVVKDHALLCDGCYRLIEARQTFFNLKMKRAELYVCQACVETLHHQLNELMPENYVTPR